MQEEERKKETEEKEGEEIAIRESDREKPTEDALQNNLYNRQKGGRHKWR